MKFSLLIHSSPFRSQNHTTALRFAEAVINQGHELYRVFFQHEAVLIANNLITPAQDEFNLQQAWQALASTHDADLVICVASAVKRGIVNEFEAKRHELDYANLAEHFVISGLGQLIDASANSDRVITFGDNH